VLLLNCSGDLVSETVRERGEEEERRFHDGPNVVLIVTMMNGVPFVTTCCVVVYLPS